MRVGDGDSVQNCTGDSGGPALSVGDAASRSVLGVVSRGAVPSKLVPSANCAYEIVIDGVDETAVGTAMAAAARAAVGAGVVAVGAGNYGGKLGKYHFPLREWIARHAVTAAG